MTTAREMGTITIRSGDERDLEDARSLTNRSWLATYSPLIGEMTVQDLITGKHSAERFASQLRNPDGLFLVAVEEDTLVGHCYGYQDKGFYVDRLHVDPDRKGGGIGRKLLDEVDSRVGKETRIWLDVLEGNEAAMKFYERVGFVRFGKTDNCGGLAGIPAVLFEKTPDQGRGW